MSLINEALKRTRDAAPQSSAAQPPVVDQYQIADNSPTISSGPRRGMTPMAVAGIAVVAAVILFLVGRSILPGPKAPEQLQPVPTVHPATASSSSASASPASNLQNAQAKDSAPQVQAAPAPATKTPVAEDASEAALVAKVMEKMKAEQAAAAAKKPEPPKLVLQGITRQGNSREAMINGYSLREGDDIEGARVVAIESRSVRVRFADQELLLRMP